MNKELRKAIEDVVEAGFEVVNKRGGYLAKDERFGWYHQTAYRSTHDCSEDKDQALDGFLSESQEHDF